MKKIDIGDVGKPQQNSAFPASSRSSLFSLDAPSCSHSPKAARKKYAKTADSSNFAASAALKARRLQINDHRSHTVA
jgi:hypothetical protein